jgi:hypothetical protein
MTKKIFAISTILLVVVIAAIFVYNFAFKKAAPPKTETEKTSQEGKIPSQTNQTKTEPSSPSTITAVSEEAVFGATPSTDEDFLYYFLKSNGQLNQVGLSGKLEKVLSTETFYNIRKVIWNKSKNKAVIKTEPTPGKMKFLYFDVSGKKITTLKENLDSVAWHGKEDKIIYKYYDSKTKKRTVSIADPDGKNWRDVANFDYHGVEIASAPGPSGISFWPSPSAYTPTSVNTVTLSGENKKEILKDRFGADVLWSPDGAKAAVSFSDQKGGHKIQLALMNSQGGEFQTLMMATFATKCAWSADSKALYCALPGNIPDSAILPNDWLEGKISSTDTFWKIDVASGKKDRIVDPEKIEGSYDALAPFLSKDEKSLFFVNKGDGKLYKITS